MTDQTTGQTGDCGLNDFVTSMDDEPSRFHRLVVRVTDYLEQRRGRKLDERESNIYGDPCGDRIVRVSGTGDYRLKVPGQKTVQRSIERTLDSPAEDHYYVFSGTLEVSQASGDVSVSFVERDGETAPV